MSHEFDVVDLGPADPPPVGAVAPEFVRPLVGPEYWADTALSSLVADGPVVLLFHSMAGAAPTTYLWREIATRGWDDYDATVTGVSVSDPYALKRLVDDRELQHRLFADPANNVAEAYGIVHDLDGMSGISEPRQAVFVLDRERTVRHRWVATQWPDYPDFDELEVEIAEAIDADG